jgi:hypothetical protein
MSDKIKVKYLSPDNRGVPREDFNTEDMLEKMLLGVPGVLAVLAWTSFLLFWLLFGIISDGILASWWMKLLSVIVLFFVSVSINSMIEDNYPIIYDVFYVLFKLSGGILVFVVVAFIIAWVENAEKYKPNDWPDNTDTYPTYETSEPGFFFPHPVKMESDWSAAYRFFPIQ